MVKKQVKNEPVVQEEQGAEDIEGDELFDGLQSTTPD